MALQFSRLNNLQALRFYAAASVMLVHLLPLYGLSAPFGHYGVDLFFVLSGFLMTRIAATDSNCFLSRRLIRIVPAYWLCTLGVFAIAAWLPGLLQSTQPDPVNLLKSLLFVPYRKESGLIQPMLNLGWTLNYEIFFYLIFAAVLWWKLPKPGVVVAAILVTLVAAGKLFRPQSDVLQFYTASIILDFLLGVVVCLVSDVAPSKVRGWTLLLLVAMLAVLPFIETLAGIENRVWFLGIPAALIIWLAVQVERLGHSATNRILLLAGDASYLLYLTHMYVLQAGAKLFSLRSTSSVPVQVVLGIGLVASAIAVACALHLWVELPILKQLKSRLLSRRDRGVRKIPDSSTWDSSSPLQDINVAVVWAQYGPYHLARVAGLQRLLGRDRVHAIELSDLTADYAWKRATGNVSLTTLCPGAVTERLGFWQVFRQARRTLAERNIDVCLLPSYSPKSSLAVLLAGKSLRIRCVMMNESHAGTARAQGLVALAKRGLVGLFEAALVGGHPQKNYFTALGLDPEKIFAGYDAVDNDYFSQKAEEIRKQSAEVRIQYGLPRHYFLSLGRFVPKKNLETLVRAFALFLKSSPNLPLAAGTVRHLVLVGSGEEESKLRALCGELRLPVHEKLKKSDRRPDLPGELAGVHFYGFRQIEENPVFYALAEAFVLPSLYEEWGLVVNEAMACGLPVIVSETAGCAEDLLPAGLPSELDSVGAVARIRQAGLRKKIRRNGFVFDPASSDELANALRLLSCYPKMRTAMGRSSSSIVEKFSCENFGRQALLAARAAMGQSRPGEEFSSQVEPAPSRT